MTYDGQQISLVFTNPTGGLVLRQAVAKVGSGQGVTMGWWVGASAPPIARARPGSRRASNTGVIMVAGQKIALGSVHAHTTVRSYKASRPRKAAQ